MRDRDRTIDGRGRMVGMAGAGALACLFTALSWAPSSQAQDDPLAELVPSQETDDARPDVGATGGTMLELRMRTVDFGEPWGPGELVLRDLEACVESPTGRYGVQAESTHGNGRHLRLGDTAGNFIRYRLIWSDGTRRDEIPGDETVRGPFMAGNADCSAGDTNARADVVVSEDDWHEARAGRYGDTLKLNVIPE